MTETIGLHYTGRKSGSDDTADSAFLEMAVSVLACDIYWKKINLTVR